MSAEHTYKFNVAMHCDGCSGAVERVLKKMDGVKSYNVSLKEQTAEVITEESVDYQIVLEKIKKTGKKVKSGEADGKEMPVELLPAEPRPVEPLPVEAVA
ncbi:heavy-metal-associated domain-containing protein [Cenococcum geophilum 1.58]|uniref:heavy-metal-associated domain-containing protein n=1 Tax=Cenococcum geophilum 1.58 TaxID=794803 RepID=UPI00358F5757|nr:heavy-metal-associated domain-containing protein [Cenococcum geophilum 1.58]